MDKRTPNDLSAAVPKFCLAVEEFRRTAEGRVRTPQEFLQHFFPHDASKVTDRIFKFLPNEVRGPVLTSWGLRGAKSALKDTDEKVQSVVWDALLAGDIDQDAFEQALVSDIVVKWAPLTDWWTFWRGGKLSKLAIHKALDSAYELALFDAKWFFETIEGPGGKLKGTDVVSEGLTKAELTEWVRKIHASGDGSPKGLLGAIGWDRIVGKTPNDVLIRVLDAFAQKVALAAPAPAAEAKTDTEAPSADERPSTRMTPVPQAPADLAEAALANATVGGVTPATPPVASLSGTGGVATSIPTTASVSNPSIASTSIPSLGSSIGSSIGASARARAPFPSSSFAATAPVTPPRASSPPSTTNSNNNPISSLPTEGEIDQLFSESKIPPPDEQMIVVEEDIEITGAPSTDEGTTNRPPAEAEPAAKPRQPTMIGQGPAPAARGRR